MALRLCDVIAQHWTGWRIERWQVDGKRVVLLRGFGVSTCRDLVQDVPAEVVRWYDEVMK